MAQVRPKTTASIPSRFETTLVVGPRERNGFGQRTHRFSDQETDTPGPGSYQGANPGVEVRSAHNCGSVSVKGFTGLVSRTDRFGYSDREYERSAVTPGPGAHYSAKPSRATTAPVPVPLFKNPKYFRGHEPVTERSPGPGKYDVVDVKTREDKTKSKRLSSFMADGIQRFKANEKAASAPAPDSYDVVAAQAFVRTQGRAATALPDSVFRSTSTRSQCIDMSSRKSVPGPGSYEPDLALSATSTAGRPSAGSALRRGAGGTGGGAQAVVPQNSSMFSNTNLDRFGKPYQSKVIRVESPGPGGNAPSEANNSFFFSDSHTGSSSSSSAGALPAFRSKGNRFEDTLRKKLERGPGPAFYQPLVLPPKKSFALNAASRWM